MINRRKFFQNTGALALSALALPSISKGGNFLISEREEVKKIKAVGLQLYSLKDVLEKDLKGTLQQIANVGYKEIESYPGSKGHYYGMEPKEFSSMLNGMGLKLVSSHFGSGKNDGKAESWHQATMLTRFDELVDKAAETGQPYLTCSSLDKSLRTTPEDLKRTAELFNKVGEKCKKAGLQFAYHNHAFEFEKIGDSLMYDFMLENTDAKLVQWEMDIFWLVAGQHDPVAYFKKYPNRFPLCHVKDMDKLDKKKNTEIGNGSIDYVNILKEGKKAGMKHFIVEQESFTRPSIESMEMNYKSLSVYSV
ncbi:sugar phosphate isomerase/epimerase family protein [Dyadobacter frigoris]|uniref:Sugar phosphate isomerase/epimerase n=1 Tax=Dyadobacter frigoris TaxID=2576211 RepID=A0A4U6D7J2_9BACT|nr:sugar phosphate isomerase/epimerase [Dyadobacter frigoris]TKT92485.1 sugar phosphate isomerase/epimerase [Dyadobacter frigoris]GLU55275.1 sugar phosphate isomerase [Dyadobacter frigoris]